MKVVFLDFDDVINSRNTAKILFEWPKGYTRMVRGLEAKQVERANQIITAVPTKVVICSSWRCYNDMDELKSFLWGAGAVFIDDIIGQTPENHLSLYKEREGEIAAWLEAYYRTNDDLEAFCILDNEHCPAFWEQQVKPNENVGLLPKHVRQGIKILTRPVAPRLTKAGLTKREAGALKVVLPTPGAWTL